MFLKAFNMSGISIYLHHLIWRINKLHDMFLRILECIKLTFKFRDGDILISLMHYFHYNYKKCVHTELLMNLPHLWCCCWCFYRQTEHRCPIKPINLEGLFFATSFMSSFVFFHLCILNWKIIKLWLCIGTK